MDNIPAVVLGNLTLVRPLAMAGIPVIAVTTTSDDVTLRSRFVDDHVVVPGYAVDQQAETVALLTDLGRRFDTRLPLIYGIDAQVDMLHRHRTALEAHYLFMLDDDGVGTGALDKDEFATICEQRGILVPKTVAPNPGDDLDEALASMRDPLLIKPRRKTAWHEIRKALFDGFGKARTFETAADLLANPAFRKFAHELIVQEHLGSDPREVFSFHGFADSRGRLLGSFCGRKIHTYPVVAGESSYIEIVQNAELDAIGHNLAVRLGLKGPFKIDLIRDARTGHFYTLEVNTRFTLWNYLGAAHGVNLPTLAYHHLLTGESGEEVKPAPHRTVKWVAIWGEYRLLREGYLGLGEWLRTVAPPGKIYPVFAWNDPMPAVYWLTEMIKLRLSR